jgi:hypothetical protein
MSEAAKALPQITRKGKSRPKGIDHDLTIKMRKSGMSYNDIAKAQGCSRANIIQVLARYAINQEHVENFKKHRADILAGLQGRLLQSITPADIKKAPLGSKVLAVAQLYDKERLERGQSTTNIDVHVNVQKISEIDAEIARLEGLSR